MTGLEELASVDGLITSSAEATVPMKDDGLYRGDGAFEVIRLYGGEPFALGEHLDRLGRSAARIALEFDRAALEAEIAALLDRAGAIDGSDLPQSPGPRTEEAQQAFADTLGRELRELR